MPQPRRLLEAHSSGAIHNPMMDAIGLRQESYIIDILVPIVLCSGNSRAARVRLHVDDHPQNQYREKTGFFKPACAVLFETPSILCLDLDSSPISIEYNALYLLEVSLGLSYNSFSSRLRILPIQNELKQVGSLPYALCLDPSANLTLFNYHSSDFLLKMENK